MDMDYDVFLSHRGPDVKNSFLAHLDEALRAKRLNPFVDKPRLVPGDSASRGISKALDVAKMYVVVVSERYAESTHCLRELVIIMRSGKRVIPIFYNVEPAQLLVNKNGPFTTALEQHHQSTEDPNEVEEWREALRKLADTTGFCFRLSDYHGDEAVLKRKVVDAILKGLPSRGEGLQVNRHMVDLETDQVIATMINESENSRNLEKMCGATCLLVLVGLGWYVLFEGLLWIVNSGSFCSWIMVTCTVLCLVLGCRYDFVHRFNNVDV